MRNHWRAYAVDGCRLIEWRYGYAANGEATTVYRERLFATERELVNYLWPDE